MSAVEFVETGAAVSEPKGAGSVRAPRMTPAAHVRSSA